jgi:hypothetical protein
MASKNMMNHYLRPNLPFALNVLLTLALCRKPDGSRRATAVAAPSVAGSSGRITLLG